MKQLLSLLVIVPMFLTGQVVVNSGLTEEFSIVPGNSQNITVQLKNTSDDPRRITFTLNDYINDCENGYVYVDSILTGESCQPWIRLEADELILLPRESREFQVQVTVPEDFDGPSAKTCLFMNNTALIDSIQQEGMIQFGIQIRYGINILYNNPRIAADIDLYAQSMSIDSISDGHAISISLMNRGNASTTFTSKLDILDNQGNTVYSSNSTRQSIQPLQCRTVSFSAKNLEGNYEMILMSETKEGKIFGFTETLNL